MRHVEGGWPKDVDFTEQSDVSRFRKKAEKDDEYKGAVKALGPIVARCMKQVNTIDIYEVKLLCVARIHPKFDVFGSLCRNTLKAIMWTIRVNRRVRRVSRCFAILWTTSERRRPLTGIRILLHPQRSQFHIRI